MKAFELVLANPLAIGEVFNISGPRYVTFDGIAKACAEAMGAPPPELVHFNPKEFDFGKKKAFPLRDQVRGGREMETGGEDGEDCKRCDNERAQT